MGLADIADGLARGVDGIGAAMAAPFSETTVRLGVTGLSRAGKTVFITSLVANLMDRGRMPQLRAAADGRIRAAWLQPQPDDTVARFEYESHLAALTGPDPHWPDGTRRISELRLSLRVAPQGFWSLLSGPRTLHLDIVDYPGEWLLDLALMDESFAQWSARVMTGLAEKPGGAAYQEALAAADPAARFDEGTAQTLARAWTRHLAEARRAGLSDLSPGRFLMPGDLEGSPALTFAPLPLSDGAGRGSLARECERRFRAYQSQVVTPFFRDHFARIDRQVVLIDALGALAAGPAALADLRGAMAGILAAFRPGRAGWLARLLGRRGIDRLLFAATKADHLHHSQHPALTSLAEALLRSARDRADYAGATTAALSIAALRSTVEDRAVTAAGPRDVVRGRLAADGRAVAFHPGDLPADPRSLMAAESWPIHWQAATFAPAPLTLRPGEGPPHIRLDKAAEFLIGDLL